jgi:putative oxidoreductase
MLQKPGRVVVAVATLLGVVMVGGGLSKLAGESHQVAMFNLVGLPKWFLLLVGTFEVVGGVLLLIPAMTPVGSLILATIMVGAIWTHVAQADWVGVGPVTVLLALFLWIFSRNRGRALRLLGANVTR